MRHIPNIISGIRILLIPVFVFFMLKEETVCAGSVLVISGLSDLLDGFLARRYGWTSQLGKVLDPFADKLTQVSVCLVLAVRLPRFWPFFVFLLLKDTAMLVLGAFLWRKKVKIEGSRWFGKLTTVLFYAAMILIVFIPAMPGGLAAGLLTLVAGCALMAGLRYIPDFKRYNRQRKE
ncbi:MAG: CDP-alcohol phosphatidyltransferase family protein [Oscillospiraceae bacterium]|nr:CDP-alcohol phosphatidyltransferase family protein [Oscillospiraceae bacterium]